MIAPIFLTLEQFGAPDPGADHGLLGPSGHMSKRSRAALLLHREQQFYQRRLAIAAYQCLIDQGVLVDPSGEYQAYTWADQKADREKAAAILISHAEQMEGFVASGWRPIVHARQAKLFRDKAAAILKG